MLVSAFKKTVAILPLRVTHQPAGLNVRNRVKPERARPAEFFAQAKKQETPMPDTQKKRLSSSTIFNITFTYLKKVIQIKVLKVDYFSGESIYKIPIGSSLSKHAQMCWLQYRLKDWSIILGHGLDEKLKSAITSAIEYHEIKTIV